MIILKEITVTDETQMYRIGNGQTIAGIKQCSFVIEGVTDDMNFINNLVQFFYGQGADVSRYQPSIRRIKE